MCPSGPGVFIHRKLPVVIFVPFYILLLCVHRFRLSIWLVVYAMVLPLTLQSSCSVPAPHEYNPDHNRLSSGLRQVLTELFKNGTGPSSVHGLPLYNLSEDSARGLVPRGSQQERSFQHFHS